MYPTNLHGNSLVSPKPVRPGTIKNAAPWLSPPPQSPLCPMIGRRKNCRTEDGLAQFQPVVCRETVMLGRYPGRNQFLSQYILNKTGELRTAKQVRSRLQQLRDSCDQKLQDLLFPSPYSSLASGCPLTGQPEMPHLFIFIDIIPEGSPIQAYESSSQPWSERENVVHISRHPRRLSSINPTVTFVAPSPLLAQSRFAVCTDDGTVHTESGLLTTTNDNTHTQNAGGCFHSAQLVPSYWKNIVNSPGTRRNMFGVEPLKSYPPSMGVRLGPLGIRKSGAYVEPVSLDPAFRE
ncbi:hypothetical protein B0H13DRAFT_1896962 [Mycena leptocephala]|nr:hypothetical protein B0H13DRAFT_1896962 [Mycena leptocephala]